MREYSELKRLAEAAQYENCQYHHELVAATKAFFEGCIPEQILELIAERDQLKVELEKQRGVMACVVNEVPRHTNRNGNAPGHCHSIPGVWGRDNGAKAGTECGWCKVWNAAVAKSKEPEHD